MMSVNKAITRLANMKQIVTENLYMNRHLRLIQLTCFTVTKEQYMCQLRHFSHLNTILSVRLRRIVSVFSKALLCILGGLDTCPCSPGTEGLKSRFWVV